MRTENAETVAGRILQSARAVGAPSAVVATDGDGTLWSGDVGDDLYFALCASGRLGRAAADLLAAEARAHGLPDAVDPPSVARLLHEAHGEGRFPEERMFELMACAFAGWGRPEIHAFARDALERAGLASRMHPEVRGVLGRLAAEGIEVVVVSASPRAAVLEALAILDLGSVVPRALTADAHYDGETMRPDVVRPIPYGPGKLRALRAAYPDRPIVAAFGDNAFDLAMLDAATVPVAVRPKPRLRERAGEIPRLVELSRD